MTVKTPHEITGSARAVAAMHVAMHVLFVVLLAIAGIKAVGRHAIGGALAVAALLAVYLLGLALERRQTAFAPVRSAASAQMWITCLVGVWVASLFVDFNFAWVAFALYFLILHVARPALRTGLVVITLGASIAALVGHSSSRASGVIGPVMGAVVAIGVSWIYAVLRRESKAHAALAAELLQAQDDVFGIQESLALAQHRSGVLAERERLARDIHDTLAQDFSSILLLARAGLATPNGGRDRDILTQIETTASTGLGEAREVVYALAPAEITQSPLVEALHRLAERLSAQTGIDAEIELVGTPHALPISHEVALLRITQGAFSNIRNHASASRARVTLEYAATEVRLEIIDDGVGFDPTGEVRLSLSGGLGLRAIRERAEHLGGSFFIESSPGEGCAIITALPVNVREEAP